MKYFCTLVLSAVGLVAQATATIPTAQLCVAPKIGSYTVTSTIANGAISIITFNCIDPPQSNVPVTCLFALIDALTEDDSLLPTPDGINKIFTLVNTPIPGTIKIFKNGTILNAPGDYTLNGKILTLKVPPSSTDSFILFYVLPRQILAPIQ